LRRAGLTAARRIGRRGRPRGKETMIPGPELAAWLRDRPAQARALDRIDACARDWSRRPLMRDLESEMDACGGRLDAILAAARRFLDRGEEVESLVADMIAAGRADPFFRPPFHPVSSEIHSGLLLFNYPLLSIALGVSGADALAAKKARPSGAASIHFTGTVSLFRYLKAGGATLSFWEADPIGPDFIAGSAGRCRLTERRPIRDGEEILVDGRSQSFVIEHARSDILYFQAMIRAEPAPLAVEYDTATLDFVGASSTDEAASRVQMMASLLRLMERDDAVPLVAESLASAPHFYTRWHLARELMAMDAEAAFPVLRGLAAADPHPEVRTAAARALQTFYADELAALAAAAPQPAGPAPAAAA
jgi:hypothetical protein